MEIYTLNFPDQHYKKYFGLGVELTIGMIK